MGAPQAAALPRQGSFLDEWLAKQQAGGGQAGRPGFVQPPGTPPMPAPQPFQPPVAPAQSLSPPLPPTPPFSPLGAGLAPAGPGEISSKDTIAQAQPVSQAPPPPLATQPPAGEGVVDLRPSRMTTPAPSTDTIAIDNDGTFRGMSDVATDKKG